MTRAGLALVLCTTSCVSAMRVQENLQRTADTIAAAHRVYAPLCAPEALATAQAHLDFTRVELYEGNVGRASDHIDVAYQHAVTALQIATPCGGVDEDRDTIPDIVDDCPLEPEDRDGDRDQDGCPEGAQEMGPQPLGDTPVAGASVVAAEIPLDTDGDGINDVDDACPDDVGQASTDGCPVPDNDGDGVPNNVDSCVDEPESFNDYLDEDGCPDVAPSRVRITRTQIQIEETVAFEAASAVLLTSSHEVLDEVARVLVDSPELRLRIEGHTDSAGSDVTNMRLSQERAQAVVDYLVGQGVGRDRLTSIGFGESRPIDTNRTDSGRARNRRVEFHIVNDG